MRFRLFDWFLKEYKMPDKYKLIAYDEHDNEHCLVGLCSSLAKEVVRLEERITTMEQKYEGALMDIKRLEEENVELTNCLYEVENRLQAKIDNIHPVTYNLNNYGLEK
jgi:septal ring factor EnvC (AmiA/AmiB activator)